MPLPDLKGRALRENKEIITGRDWYSGASQASLRK
jgi:hypothetical protein